MISEGSCDTEDWNKILDLIKRIIKFVYIAFVYNQIESRFFILCKYFTIVLFLLYFGSNKCRLGEQKIIILKNITNLTFQKHLTGSVHMHLYISIVNLWKCGGKASQRVT